LKKIFIFRKQENFKKCLFNIHHIIKTNQFSSKNFEKLQEYLHKISHQQVSKQKSNVIKSIEPPKIECIVQEIPSPPTPPIQQEETLDSLLQSDEIYMSTLKSLSELNEETMSIINNQLAIEAIEAGDVQSGIETLQTSAKDGKNAAALYNLGICYERGIGVKQDRAKVKNF
jgi:TPR repeat protein